MGMWELDDLAGNGDLADGLGVGKATVANWTVRYPDFPKPLIHLAAGPVWSRSQVKAWHDSRDWKSGRRKA